MKDTLARVAAVYGAARDDGKPPTQAVADRLHVTYGQAANLVTKARAHGYLQGGPNEAATRGSERPA